MLRRLFLGVCAAVLLGLVMPAQPKASVDEDNAAVITKDLNCHTVNGFLWDGTGTSAGTGIHIETSSGNHNLKCTSEITGTPPNKAVVKTGFLCLTPWGSTTDTHSVATPSGKLNYECDAHD